MLLKEEFITCFFPKLSKILNIFNSSGSPQQMSVTANSIQFVLHLVIRMDEILINCKKTGKNRSNIKRGEDFWGAFLKIPFGVFRWGRLDYVRKNDTSHPS